mgnify:CR=1 FL=1
MTPLRLWKGMSVALRLDAARAFWDDPDAADMQAQAALLIAQHKKFRAKTVVGLDRERKARHLASLPALPDPIAARVLVVYHLAEQRPMMGAFLDALGIAHDDGLIQQDEVMPDAAKLGPAVARIAGQFPPEVVRLYLRTLLCQDPQTWGGLSEAVDQLEPGA